MEAAIEKYLVTWQADVTRAMRKDGQGWAGEWRENLLISSYQSVHDFFDRVHPDHARSDASSRYLRYMTHSGDRPVTSSRGPWPMAQLLAPQFSQTFSKYPGKKEAADSRQSKLLRSFVRPCLTFTAAVP